MEPLPWLVTAQSRHLLVELAGVFWLVAELALLHLVWLGREHLQHTPHSPHLTPSRAARMRLFSFAALSVLLLALVVGRRMMPLPDNDMVAIVAFEQMHLAVWSAFVVGWVVLEALIVYQGWRGYRYLCLLLCEAPKKPSPPPVGTLIVGTMLLTALGAATLASAEPMYGNIDHALEASRNTVYFYLRVAGVAWIALEWCAVWILWRSFALIRRVEATR